MNMVNYSEAKQESDRLSRVLKRDVEVRTKNCNCDYDKSCGVCGGQGYTYELVYAFCDHVVQDGDDLVCNEQDCIHQGYIASVEREEELETVTR